MPEDVDMENTSTEPLDNPRWERYCQERAGGRTQRQAMLVAYPSRSKWKPETVDKRSNELESNGEVKGRLATLKRAAADAATLTRAEVLSGMGETFRRANESNRRGMSQVGVQAVSSIGRTLLAALPDPVDAAAPVPVVDFATLVGPDFLAAHRAITAGTLTDLWMPGGRGSLKSSFASLELAYALMRDRDAHALVMQARGVDIRDETFPQVTWALDQLGVLQDWDLVRSAHRMENRETHQTILFRGCDDPAKTKGIKVPFGHIAVVWLEEVDQFRGMAELRSIRQSVTRGDGHVLRIHSFNPPLSRDSWANVEADRVEASDDPSEMTCRSTFLDAPREWLGEQFFTDASGLMETDEQAYRHEYLGEPTGVGGEVFTRLDASAITDDQVAGFDRLCAGEDWGWWPDPWAFVLSAWEPSTRTLYSFRELGGNRIQPDESARMVRDALTWEDGTGIDGRPRGLFHRIEVLCDDADPTAIAAHRDAGIMARAAGKGGMRMASYEWLASVRWVVDPVRCPNLAREARAMCYERDRNGEWLNSIPDGDDHWVDAVRYSTMPIVSRRGAYAAAR